MSHSPAPTFMQPPWFFVWFAAMWLAVSAILSRVSGWSRLAEQYRSDEPGSGERFRFQSGSIGARRFPASYRSVLTVFVTPLGFRLSLIFPFGFMAPPLFIPWSAVESVEERRRFLATGIALRIRDQWPTVTLYSPAGRALREAYQSSRAR